MLRQTLACIILQVRTINRQIIKKPVMPKISFSSPPPPPAPPPPPPPKATPLVINFVCVHDSCIRFLLFSLVSIAVWIDYNRLQSTGAKLFCIWNFQLSAAFFGIGESPSRALWFTLLTSTQGRIYSVATNQNLRIIIYKGKTDN